jgi:hypothetical protein
MPRPLSSKPLGQKAHIQLSTKYLEVDDRVFLLGLDELYREAIKPHEREALLDCARRVSSDLRVSPSDVSIEGYYIEDEALTEYFRLIRALRAEPPDRRQELADTSSLDRLQEVTSSKIYGRTTIGEKLLPAGSDPLSEALEKTIPNWTVKNLTQTAYECAKNSDDYSLVALAALSQDPIVLTALRESVVLYAVPVPLAAFTDEPEYVYVWSVDPIIEERAKKFVTTFNELFNERLPAPDAANAAFFYNASDLWSVLGRCVRLGYDDSVDPVRHYHWGIKRGEDFNLRVEEFWDTVLWTTEQYSKLQNPTP